MIHKFEPKNMQKLDNEWRRANLPPDKTLEKLGLSSSDIVADIGCGVGYFSIPAAEIINNKNKIFVLDTSEEMLREVERRANIAVISKIVTIKTEEYDLKIPDKSVTFALIVNVIHEIEDKHKFAQEIIRILKPDGKIAIVEWKKESMEMGPPIDHRIGREEIIEIFNSCGVELKDSFEFANVFYGVVFCRDK